MTRLAQKMGIDLNYQWRMLEKVPQLQNFDDVYMYKQRVSL